MNTIKKILSITILSMLFITMSNAESGVPLYKAAGLCDSKHGCDKPLRKEAKCAKYADKSESLMKQANKMAKQGKKSEAERLMKQGQEESNKNDKCWGY